ncbi:DedA family protein [Actinomyces slackii]|uniref:SNARE associated Golgi protein n=1 Tax=Actinomyces slackii TaxID=52774 RepID=A0A3S5EM89_9ACTO|nr:hypothetical protein [Actinomyces slackii]VEG74988.1 Uncharacterised protein [Actinomyces slackii]
MDRINDLPYGWLFAFFWCLGMMRSHTMYWIGRGITAGTAHSRWAGVLETPLYATAQAWAARWGVLAIPMSFLTVGLQSCIQISAGVTRMRLGLYSPAAAAGSVVWAAVYTTVGMAVIAAWLSSPAGRVVSVLIAAAVIGSIIAQHRHAGSRMRPSSIRDPQVHG